MKTPIVQETRRAGTVKSAAHRRQVMLVERSLVVVHEPRYAWDERTRSERRSA
jgi:hypothetical protein